MTALLIPKNIFRCGYNFILSSLIHKNIFSIISGPEFNKTFIIQKKRNKYLKYLFYIRNIKTVKNLTIQN